MWEIAEDDRDVIESLREGHRVHLEVKRAVMNEDAPPVFKAVDETLFEDEGEVVEELDDSAPGDVCVRTDDFVWEHRDGDEKTRWFSLNTAGAVIPRFDKVPKITSDDFPGQKPNVQIGYVDDIDIVVGGSTEPS